MWLINQNLSSFHGHCWLAVVWCSKIEVEGGQEASFHPESYQTTQSRKSTIIIIIIHSNLEPKGYVATYNL